jgi:hypothetical protein
MKKKPQLIRLLNFFAETLRETLEEPGLSQAEIARRCTPESDLRLSAFFAITPGLWMNL